MTPIERINSRNYKTATLIPMKILSVEAELMVSKWHTYRFLSPLTATRHFHLEYRKAYIISYKKNTDLYEAEKLQIGYRTDFFKQNSAMTQLWLARQFADHLGVPYPSYLEFCFDFATRRKRRHYPQPNQLGPNANTAVAWAAKFKEYWTPDREQVDLSRAEPMGQYCVDNFQSLPVQIAFQRQLITAGAVPSRNFHYFIRGRVHELRQLDLKQCVVAYGKDRCTRAFDSISSDLRIAPLEVQAYPALEGGELLQGCWGLPGINTSENVSCATCPQKSSCNSQRAEHLVKLTTNFGNADPLETKRRKKQQVRTARSREKRRKAQQELDAVCTGQIPKR